MTKRSLYHEQDKPPCQGCYLNKYCRDTGKSCDAYRAYVNAEAPEKVAALPRRPY